MSPARKDTGVGTGKSYLFQIDVHLGTSIEEEGGMETEITKRVGACWSNWKNAADCYSTIGCLRN